jgi:hypothetical protein
MSLVRPILVAATVIFAILSSAYGQGVEEELGIHRLDTETFAPYDAAAYLNRIPTEPDEDATPVQYAGTVIYSRLPNIEGRVQVKILEGFDRDAYFGYKSFMRAWPDPGFGIGNCVVCHIPPTFTDGAKHVVDESGEAKMTPSLRNLNKSDEELTVILNQKVKLAEKARDGSIVIDEAYKVIELKESDVKEIVSFLQSLNEVPKEKFRQIIVDAEILDTTDIIE